MSQEFRSRLRFLPLAPALVGALGIAVAVTVGLLGLENLREDTVEAAELRAEVLARTIAVRLRATSAQDRKVVVERAARRSGAELLLVESNGEVLVDAMLKHPSTADALAMLVATQGTAATALGTARYFATPLDQRAGGISLIAFVRLPETPAGARALVTSIAALAALLTGVAALVAFALARDVHSDVAYVRRRILAIANTEPALRPRPIPVRSVDQVGVLTDAFNVLAQRFIAAEHAYRQDLDAAKRYDRDRSAFLAALSHELRTPLNAILGFTEILLSEVDGPLTDEAQENLTIVQNSGEHLRALIDDILDLSALESGELVLHREEANVFEIATQVVREATILAKTKNLDLTIEGSAIRATVDSHRVRQMLGNIVGNAVKFTQVGGIRVVVSEQGGEAVIRVSDTGPGIALGDQHAIFEEYRQSGERGARRGGTGLGLAITRHLAQMHGGRIELSSQLGTGSVFSLYLPVDAPPVLDSLSMIPVASKKRPDERKAFGTR